MERTEKIGEKIAIKSKGWTSASVFFIFFFLLFTCAIGYALFTFVQMTNFQIAADYYALTAIVAFLVIFIVLFVVAYSLSFENQEISISDGVLTLRKKRPLLPDKWLKANLDQVQNVFSEKLNFSFINIWYAFLFHDSYSEEDMETFIVPHLMVKNKRVAFFEYASDAHKTEIIEKLNQAIEHSKKPTL